MESPKSVIFSNKDHYLQTNYPWAVDMSKCENLETCTNTYLQKNWWHYSKARIIICSMFSGKLMILMIKSYDSQKFKIVTGVSWICQMFCFTAFTDSYSPAGQHEM